MEKMHDLIRTNVALQSQLRHHLSQNLSHHLELNGFLSVGVSTLTTFPTPARLMAQFRSLMTTNRIDVLEAWKLNDDVVMQDMIFTCFTVAENVRQAYERLCTKLTHRFPPIDMILKKKTDEQQQQQQGTVQHIITTGVTTALMAYLRQHHSQHIPHAHALNRHVRNALPGELQIGGHIETIRFVRTMLDFAWQVVLTDPPLSYRKNPETRDVELFFPGAVNS